MADDPGGRGLLPMLSAEGNDVPTASDGVGDPGGAHELEQRQRAPALAEVPVMVLTGELLSRMGDVTVGPGAE